MIDAIIHKKTTDQATELSLTGWSVEGFRKAG
jgi:hypothetical protein